MGVSLILRGSRMKKYFFCCWNKSLREYLFIGTIIFVEHSQTKIVQERGDNDKSWVRTWHVYSPYSLSIGCRELKFFVGGAFWYYSWFPMQPHPIIKYSLYILKKIWKPYLALFFTLLHKCFTCHVTRIFVYCESELTSSQSHY